MAGQRKHPADTGESCRVFELRPGNPKIQLHTGAEECYVISGELHVMGSVHDVGKITVPAEILSKPGKLTAPEWAMIKEHPQLGYEILKKIDFPWPVAKAVWQHHERMDGSGYPQGLKGADITLFGRILAVSDVVESMASHRPYRPARGIDAALAEIETNAGRLYDADVVAACLRLFREKGYAMPV